MTAVLLSTSSLTQLHCIWAPEGRVDVIRRGAPWWKKIGTQPKIEAHTLEMIEANNSHKGLELCCESLFQCWLRGAGEQPATWAVLLKALEDSNLYSLAKTIHSTLTTQFCK